MTRLRLTNTATGSITTMDLTEGITINGITLEIGTDETIPAAGRPHDRTDNEHRDSVDLIELMDLIKFDITGRQNS